MKNPGQSPGFTALQCQIRRWRTSLFWLHKN